MDKIIGLNAVKTALNNNRRKIINLYYTAKNKEYFEAYGGIICDEKTLDTKLKGKINNTDFKAQHQGVLLEAHPLYDCHNFNNNTLDYSGNVLLLDRVQDINNLGAILRVCAAFNIKIIIIPQDNSAKINSNVYKIASGALEFVEVYYVTNLVRGIQDLQKQNIWVLGFAEKTDNFKFIDIKESTKKYYKNRVAFVLGNEETGLRDLTKKTCDELVYINTSSNFSCLNVSHSLAVILAYWQAMQNDS